MAYAALTSLAGVIDRILPHEQRYIYLCSKEQMKSVHENVGRLQDFLEYISLKSFVPDIDAFESRITDTAHKMEDTIELVVLAEPLKNCCVQFLCLIFKFGKSDSPQPTPDEFSSYIEGLHLLSEEATEMRQIINNKAVPEIHHPLVTTSSREAPDSKGTKVGLENALNQILDKITRQGSQLRIIPITGMGGIGKTTLARASYEAPQALHHFDIRLWVTVSQDYNIQDILQGLLPEAKQDGERLIEYVHKHLTGRRYLIILDDMWNEKVWDRVRNAFPDDNKGSRVILTTRSSGVASYVGSSSPVHEMQFLNEDQSWDLLRENVYGQRSCSAEFEDIGRLIAKNCKGLPLAVVVIAGLLKFNKTREYWEQVAQNTDEKVTTSNDHLFEIISWSYTRLPPHLKACFLYMGAYKEDYEITTKELVMIWAAEGFLKPKQYKSMEEVAEECLKELVERSIVMVTKRSYNGKIKTCSIHDVIREVSIRKAGEEKFLYHFKPSHAANESTFRSVLAIQRRVSITNCSIANFPCDTIFPTTHSIIDNPINFSHIMLDVHCFKLLRILNKIIIRNDLGISILCTLTNLRYLHIEYLSGKSIMFPESISELQNLESLMVTPPYDSDSVFFPLEIWKLQRLRHIIVTRAIDLRVPVPNQDCPSLETLSRPRASNFSKRFTERIPNLKKLKLKICADDEGYVMDGLQLEELSVICEWYYQPTKFVFPQNLKKLSLHETNIPVENLSPIGLLPNLEVLKLKKRSVRGKEWEPKEEEFLQLEHLKMEDLDIKHWRAESIHFPHLRKLVILNCNELEEVPESIGEIDTLEKLIVNADKAKRSVQIIKEKQLEMSNQLLQVIILDYYFS